MIQLVFHLKTFHVILTHFDKTSFINAKDPYHSHARIKRLRE